MASGGTNYTQHRRLKRDEKASCAFSSWEDAKVKKSKTPTGQHFTSHPSKLMAAFRPREGFFVVIARYVKSFATTSEEQGKNRNTTNWFKKIGSVALSEFVHCLKN